MIYNKVMELKKLEVKRGWRERMAIFVYPNTLKRFNKFKGKKTQNEAISELLNLQEVNK